MGLSEKTCVPCKGGIEPITGDKAEEFLAQAEGWSLIDGGKKLNRKFEFGNFVDALGFVNKVGELAEKEQHHPDISFGWGYADIVIFTHKINGLHENDFILAAKINDIN